MRVAAGAGFAAVDGSRIVMERNRSVGMVCGQREIGHLRELGPARKMAAVMRVRRGFEVVRGGAFSHGGRPFRFHRRRAGPSGIRRGRGSHGCGRHGRRPGPTAVGRGDSFIVDERVDEHDVL